MSGSAHISSDRERPPEEETIGSHETLSQAGDDAIPELDLAIVRYDDGPDRGTIHPPELTGIAGMESWISVDLSVVVDLSMWR